MQCNACGGGGMASQYMHDAAARPVGAHSRAGAPAKKQQMRRWAVWCSTNRGHQGRGSGGHYHHHHRERHTRPPLYQPAARWVGTGGLRHKSRCFRQRRDLPIHSGSDAVNTGSNAGTSSAGQIRSHTRNHASSTQPRSEQGGAPSRPLLSCTSAGATPRAHMHAQRAHACLRPMAIGPAM